MKTKVLLFVFSLAITLPFTSFAVDGWIQQSESGIRNWNAVASSADGVKLVATVPNGGNIYTSTDSGFNWTQQTGAGSRNWVDIASSSDGIKLAAIDQGGYIYTSVDSGFNWTQQTGSGSRNWNSIASSVDGTKLIASTYDNYVYTSTDSGVNWTQQTDIGSGNWVSVASSEDGQKLFAQLAFPSSLFISTDGGINWTEEDDVPNLLVITSSADGTKLAAMCAPGNSCHIYTSIDGGTNWTEQAGSPMLYWYGLASSADGTKLVAVAGGDYIYTSIDSGVSWTQVVAPGSRSWRAVASSSDGTKIVAVPSFSYIYTYGPITTPTITTGGTVSANKNYATVSAEITDEGSGNITERGFEYGLTTSYDEIRTQNNIEDFITEGEFALPLTDLTCNTLYHYRAYVVNPAGTAYGDDETLTTASCTSTDSVTLYAVDGSGSSDEPHLYKLDPNTGVKVEDIGEVGFYVTGMAFHPQTGVLYGSVGNTGASQRGLITIDTETGAGTLLGIIRNASNQSRTMPDLAFRSDGTLFGFSSQGEDLYTIDISSCDETNCLATMVGEADFVSSGGNGIAFDNEDNLYVFAHGDYSYFKVDPATGLEIEEVDFSNPSGEFYNIPAAEFGPDETLYIPIVNYGSDPAVLATVDLTTATITRLVEHNEDMVWMDSIAFYFAPEVVAEEPEEESRSSSGSTRRVVRVEPRLTEPGNPETTPTDCLPTYNYSPSTGMKCPTLSTPTPVCLLTQTLKLWSRGEEVKCLQTKLNITSDGIFGPMTKASVIDFQTLKNLTPDGIVGPITRAVMNAN